MPITNATTIAAPFGTIRPAKLTASRMSAGQVASHSLGWAYFVCWTFSFYPQAIYNYQKKSVTGLSIDMVMGNVVGFLYLSIYTSFFYWDPYTRKQYRDRNGTGADNMVQLNDVAFAVHAFLISLVIYGQILAYKKPTEKMSQAAKALATLICLITAVSLGLWLSEDILWLDFLYTLSYLKIIITVMKYIPQAYMNYSRKSTVGWAILNVLLDFSGGLLSMVQLILDSYLSDDMGGIQGDAVKMGIGFTSFSFDCLFMFQHYVLYAHPPEDHLAFVDNDQAMDAEEKATSQTSPYNRITDSP